MVGGVILSGVGVREAKGNAVERSLTLDRAKTWRGVPAGHSGYCRNSLSGPSWRMRVRDPSTAQNDRARGRQPSKGLRLAENSLSGCCWLLAGTGSLDFARDDSAGVAPTNGNRSTP